MTGTYDFTIKQGETFNRTITYYSDEGLTSVDLTDCTARMQLRLTKDAASPLLELTTENGRITLGGSAGTISLAIVASDTAALTFDTAVYDLELVDGSTVTRLLEGNVSLNKEVTR